jgi:membrane protease YdiL (CAAX protease family)
MVNQRKRYLQLTLFLIAFFLFWTLRCTLFYAVDESIASITLRAVYSNLLKFITWILPAVVFIHVLRGSHPAKYLGLSTWPSWRNWLICLSAITAYLLVVTFFKITGGNKGFSMAFISRLPITYWFIMALVPPFLEELFFRGFLITELLALMPMYLTIATTSILFACIHVPYWFTRGATIQAIVINGSAAFGFSILTSYLFVKTRSIWPSTFAHIAANLFPQFFI